MDDFARAPRLKAETCACGSDRWHTMIDRYFWCRRCGSFRPALDLLWSIPFDRAGDVAHSAGGAADTNKDAADDEPKTDPATPHARSGQWPTPTK